MSSVTTKVTGLPNLRRAFEGLDDAVRGIARDAAEAGAEKIAAAWRDRAPQGEGDHPGPSYRDAIDVRPRKNRNGARATVAARTYRPYPYFLEYGTSKMAARPSAIPAYDAARDEAIDAAGAKLAEVLP